MLKENKAKLHDENEDLLKQLEESLYDNAMMLQCINVLKEEILILQNESSSLS